MDRIDEKGCPSPEQDHTDPEQGHDGGHDGDGHHDQVVVVQVDRIPVTSPRDTTASKLLEAAGLDPATRQLVLVQGRHQTPYGPGDRLQLRPGMAFITVSTGPTQVS